MEVDLTCSRVPCVLFCVCVSVFPSLCSSGEYGNPDQQIIKGGKWGKEMPLSYLDVAEWHGRQSPGPGAYDAMEALKKQQRVRTRIPLLEHILCLWMQLLSVLLAAACRCSTAAM
jgi:hypothetical protein